MILKDLLAVIIMYSNQQPLAQLVPIIEFVIIPNDIHFQQLLLQHVGSSARYLSCRNGTQLVIVQLDDQVCRLLSLHSDDGDPPYEMVRKILMIYRFWLCLGFSVFPVYIEK